jgi:spore coat polysaccharide biosynthesis protein SpsF
MTGDKMKIVAIIEARTGSSRLPGKVLLECNNKSMIERLLIRLQSVDLFDDIIVATTNNSLDNRFVELLNSLGIKYFRGDEENVFDRVIKCAEFTGAQVIVEISGDCPIIDPKIVTEMIKLFLSTDVDYLSNCEISTYPLGMAVEIISLEALKKSYSMTTSKLDREHVTLHIRKNPSIFKVLNVTAPENLYHPELSVTLDEPSDFTVISKIIHYLEPLDALFDCEQIIDFLIENPQIAKLNSSVIRKGDT